MIFVETDISKEELRELILTRAKEKLKGRIKDSDLEMIQIMSTNVIYDNVSVTVRFVDQG